MHAEEIRSRFGETILRFQAAMHRCPELSMQEFRTAARIRKALSPLGLEEINLPLETAVAARLRTGRSGPAIGLRADIDGIRVEESSEHACRSENPGVMHACGHDTHAAGLLGAAAALSAMRDSLAGDVIFLFQPAEESISGARAFIQAGLFDRVPMARMFSLHNLPTLPVGSVGVREGPVMAAKDEFTLTVHGTGGHGGIPDLCRDPIVASAAVITALQTVISRNLSPLTPAVLSVCSIHGGSTNNLIEDDVVMTGSARTLFPASRTLLLQRMEALSADCARAYGCTAELALGGSMPALVNGTEMTRLAENAARSTVSPEHIVLPNPSLASEDFAVYAAHVPTFFYFLGSGFPGRENAPWHSARFLAHPDTALYGAALLVNSVLEAQRA